MNFFAHAYVAADRSQHPRFLLGAMLPDLVGMLGARIAQLPDADVRAGVEHHHDADSAFHRAPTFLRLCAHAMTVLGERGLSRGCARAAGHVGIELLLDGLLSDDRTARARYSTALALAVEAETRTLVLLRDGSHHGVLRDGLARLLRAPVPEGYRDPDFVVDRLHHILARRPRIALQTAELGAVRDWARVAASQLASTRAALLAEVDNALAIGHSCQRV